MGQPPSVVERVVEVPKMVYVPKVVHVPKVEEKPKILNEPWRKVAWEPSKRTNLMQYLLDYKPSIDSVPQARILLVGPVGSGKSSFFNSINSVFHGYTTSQANAGHNEKSLTTKYRTYQVKAGKDRWPLAFLLCDTMGLEAEAKGGVNTDDIVHILKGYIPDKYTFNPVSPWQPNNEQAYKELPLKDRIHCVVYVMDASKFPVMPPETKNKVDEIRRKVNFYDIPLVVLLTKVDKACPITEKDLKDVYRSCYLKELIERASDSLGISVMNVLPVKNYSDELELNGDSDILLLTALQKMLHFAENYFDNFTPEMCHIW